MASYLIAGLVLLAGSCYMAAGWRRWRRLDDEVERPNSVVGLAGAGFLLHAAALAMAFATRGEGEVAYATLGTWVAVILLAGSARFLDLRAYMLLLMPMGGLVFFLALAIGIDALHPSSPGDDSEARSLVSFVHVAFMTGYLAALLLGGTAAILHRIATRQLKHPDRRALRIPSLPALGRLCEGALIGGSALLVGGLVSGHAAIGERFEWFHLTPILAFVSLAVMALAVGLRTAGRMGNIGLVRTNLILLGIAVVTALSLFLEGHDG